MPLKVRPPFFGATAISILVVAFFVMVLLPMFLGSLGIDIHLTR